MSDEFEMLPDAISELRSACASSSSRMVECAIVPEDIKGVASVRMSIVEMPDLVRHVRPKVVFYLAPEFDPEQEISDLLLDGEDESELDDQEKLELEKRKRNFGVKRLVNKFKPFRGKIQFLLTSFFDGVVGYYSYQEAEWLEDFNVEIERIKDQLDEQEHRDSLQERENRRIEISDAIDKILQNPRFRAGRPSRAKRIYLASMLFPEFIDEEVQEIVEQAELRLWASSEGGKT